MARMTATQRELLKTRIANLYGWSAREAAQAKVTVPDTPAVARARKIVKAFDAKNEKRKDAVAMRYRKANDDAREALYFMEPTKAYEFVTNLKPLK